jgi:hypothetical protein
VERNMECNPFLLWIAELECHPKKKIGQKPVSMSEGH